MRRTRQSMKPAEDLASGRKKDAVEKREGRHRVREETRSLKVVEEKQTGSQSSGFEKPPKPRPGKQSVEERRRINRENVRKHRASMTPEQKEEERRKNCERYKAKKDMETEDERKERLEQKRKLMEDLLAKETPEETEARLRQTFENNRRRYLISKGLLVEEGKPKGAAVSRSEARRARQTEEQKKELSKRRRELVLAARAKETPEESEARRRRTFEYNRKRYLIRKGLLVEEGEGRADADLKDEKKIPQTTAELKYKIKQEIKREDQKKEQRLERKAQRLQAVQARQTPEETEARQPATFEYNSIVKQEDEGTADVDQDGCTADADQEEYWADADQVEYTADADQDDYTVDADQDEYSADVEQDEGTNYMDLDEGMVNSDLEDQGEEMPPPIAVFLVPDPDISGNLEEEDTLEIDDEIM